MSQETSKTVASTMVSATPGNAGFSRHLGTADFSAPESTTGRNDDLSGRAKKPDNRTWSSGAREVGQGMLEILSTNRNLADTIREEEKMLTVSIEELPSYALGREAGMSRGLEQGLEQGELNRARSTLIRLLERRFSKLGVSERSQIANASLEQITDWTDRVLTEDSIQAVLRG